MFRSRSLLFGLIFILTCFPSKTKSQAWSGMLAPTRAVDWSKAGAGTVPNRTTVCQTLGAAGQSPTYAQNVTGAQIVSALQACAGSNGVVYLNPGTYTITTTLFGPNNGGAAPGNVSLRGAGPNQTILTWTGTTNNCNGIGATAFCIFNGDSGTAEYSTNVLNWTGGYSQGSTTLTLGSAVSGSLSNLQVGSLLQLNQQDQANDNGNWWNCGVIPNGSTPGCTWGGSSNAWPGRTQTQTVTVTGISGSNVTISPGIYGSDWSGSLSPYAAFSSTLPVSGFGLEDLQINTQSLGDIQAMVETEWVTNSWIKDVALINSAATSAAARKHAEISSSTHVTVRDSYLYGSSPSSEGYGVDLSWGSCDNLVENNIFQHMATGTILETGCANVFGYNYAVDNFYTGAGGAPNWQQCDAFHHDAGDAFDLWEGQEGICAAFDDMHGSSYGMTVFRSYFNGHDPATLCPGGGSGCGTGAKLQFTAAILDMAFARYTNVVASVLGTAGYHNTYQNVGQAGSPGSCPIFPWTAVYSLNFSNSNQLPFSPACVQSSFSLDNDPLAGQTLMRWGNYDVVNGSIQTNSSETATGASTYPGVSSPSVSWSSYPSFYLSAKPSWWVFPSGNASTPWPAIGPEVSGGNISGVGGHAYLTPAANCFLNVLGGKTDGSSGPLNFAASSCYPGTASAGGPAAPSNLSATIVQ